MKNLQINIERNRTVVNKTDSSSKKTTISCSQLIWGKNLEEFLDTEEKHHHLAACSKDRMMSLTTTTRRAGFDVILASDLVYMTKSLEPLWQTIDRLLIIKNDDDDNGGGTSTGTNGDDDGDANDDDHLEANEEQQEEDDDYDSNVGYVLFSWYCSSQCSMEELLAMATKYGFTWTRPLIATATEQEELGAKNNNDDAHTTSLSVQDGIYIFQRKKRKKTKT